MAVMEDTGGGEWSVVVTVLRLGDDISQWQQQRGGNGGEEGVMVKRGW